MKKMFSVRYPDLIQDKSFISDLPHGLKIKLIKHLNDFDEPYRQTVSRYDSYLVGTSAKYEALKVYWESQDWPADDIGG